MTFLVFFRVFFVPLWFGIHADKLSNREEAFERVRFHKRRSLFHDREEEGALAWHLSQLACQLFSQSKKSGSFLSRIPAYPVFFFRSILLSIHRPVFLSFHRLFLFHRVFLL